ncbi:unnamed protein product, partial [Rotaria sp. Silwood2]
QPKSAQRRHLGPSPYRKNSNLYTSASSNDHRSSSCQDSHILVGIRSRNYTHQVLLDSRDYMMTLQSDNSDDSDDPDHDSFRPDYPARGDNSSDHSSHSFTLQH